MFLLSNGVLKVISSVQPAIVALKVTFVTAFEDEQAAVALGTGFVVDKVLKAIHHLFLLFFVIIISI